MTFWNKNGMDNIDGYLMTHGQDETYTSAHKRMKELSNLEAAQNEQQMSRAAQLQARWLEVSERERRAHIFNRQLMQDFHRAMDTLNDLVARSAAMHTLRVEYERHLDELYPQWQQRLQEDRISTQRKQLEIHMRECLQQMASEAPEASSTTSAVYSHFPSHVQSNTYDVRQEGHPQNLHNTHATEKTKKPKASKNKNSSDTSGLPPLPSTWLTEVSQPVHQSSHGIPPPPPFKVPSREEDYDYSYDDDIYVSMLHDPPPFTNKQLPEASSHPDPSTRTGVGMGLTTMPNPHPYLSSWPPSGLPMLNPAILRSMGMPEHSVEDDQSGEEVGEERGEGGGRKREGRGGGGEGTQTRSGQVTKSASRRHKMGMDASDLTGELDTKPVRLSGGDEESTSGSRKSTDKRKDVKGTKRPVLAGKEDMFSQKLRASLGPNLKHKLLCPKANIEHFSSESVKRMKSPFKISKISSVEVSRENSKDSLTSKTQSEESSSESVERMPSKSRGSKNTDGATTQKGVKKEKISTKKTSKKQSQDSSSESVELMQSTSKRNNTIGTSKQHGTQAENKNSKKASKQQSDESSSESVEVMQSAPKQSASKGGAVRENKNSKAASNKKSDDSSSESVELMQPVSKQSNTTGTSKQNGDKRKSKKSNAASNKQSDDTSESGSVELMQSASKESKTKNGISKQKEVHKDNSDQSNKGGSKKMSGIGLITSTKAQKKPLEIEEEIGLDGENMVLTVLQVPTTIRGGGRDERQETNDDVADSCDNDDDESDEEGLNKGSVGERKDGGHSSDEEEDEEDTDDDDDDDDDDDEEDEDEDDEDALSHSGHQKADGEEASEKALSVGLQSSANPYSKTNYAGSPKMYKDADGDIWLNKNKPPEEEENEEDDDNEEDEDEEDEESEEEEEEGEDEEDDDEEEHGPRNEAEHSGDGGEDENDEDEDLYDQEIEDEDEDDEVIVMDEHSHSDGRKNSLPKCLFDEDDDIEDLLAPRPEEPGPKTVIPIVVVNAKESDSEKEVPLKKNSATAPDKEVVLRSIIDSDDEFDHFYD